MHAEIDAIIKLKTNYRKQKSVIALIFRISKDGNKFLLGKPCVNCKYQLENTIRKKGYNVSKIYYTTSDETIETMV